MTVKRFTVPKNYRCIQDTLTKEHYLCEDKTEAINLAYLLNELSDENEQLKHDATILILSNQDYRKENEQLKQFKEDVFNKIDMHLRMLPTARDNEFDEDDGDPSLYVGAIYMLETLKKELEE